jgi:hypothetical protein
MRFTSFRSPLSVALVVAGVACSAGPSATGAGPGTTPAPAPSPGSPDSPAGSPATPGPSEGPPSLTWQTEPPPAGAVSAEAQVCANKDDCEKVVITCCDECNGGTAVAVAKAQASSVKKAACGPDVRCTMMGCFTRVECESGKCVVQRGVAK